jgi:hypothetical protein
MNNITVSLGYAKEYACWVPCGLTDYHRTVEEEVFSDLFSHYKADGESFLSQIVSGNETWIHDFELQTKRLSVEWHHPSSPWKMKFRVIPSAGIVMTPLFWDV